MIAEEIISKLDLKIMDEPYGDSIHTGAQWAVFKTDEDVHFFDANNLGILYLTNIYRIEKTVDLHIIRLFIQHNHIIESTDNVAARIIKSFGP